MSSRQNRGPSREVVAKDIHGETLFANAEYVANADEVGSVGRGFASSGISVSGVVVELTAELTFRKSMAINNQGSDTLFVGPSGNSLANLYPVAGSGGQISFNATSGARIYGLTDGTIVDVRVLEMG
jgi:hypothetical protein